MFTTDNTEGFTQDELNELNSALEKLIAFGWGEKEASDALTNAWSNDSSNTSGALIERVVVG